MSESKPLRLYRERFPGRAVFDTAISHALLRSVAGGDAPESLRLYSPDRALLFSSLDARRPGYSRAVELARAAGFEPVTRLAGGHAAVFLESSLAFAWASADSDAPRRIKERFERLSNWMCRAVSALGLDARVGEVPGEYCPGEYSLNIAGGVKVMGVGQRVIRGGAHVGGVVTIDETASLRAVLEPIYAALELPFRSETAGGLADYDSTIDCDRVVESLRSVLVADGYAIEEASFDESLSRAAESLAPHHAPFRDSTRDSVAPLGERSSPSTGPKTVLQSISHAESADSAESD